MQKADPRSLAVVLLAAGRGTRMRSRTPKVLHSLGGVPLIHHPLRLAKALGASPTVVVVSPDADDVRASAQQSFGQGVRFAEQEVPRGTGDAVRSALSELEDATGTLLILSGDVPNLDLATVLRLLELRAKSNAAVAFLSFEQEDPGGYGRVIRDYKGRVQRIVEARDCTPAELAVRELNSGIYAVQLSLLRELLADLDDDNAQGELYLTDMVEVAADRKHGVEALCVPREIVAGVNDRVDLARALKVWRRRRNEALMRSGVTMEDPDTVFVGALVHVERDAELEPQVRITGASRIGEGARIGTGCVLEDTVVDVRASLLPYTVCEQARIGARATVGPFARLRPGTVLGERVKVGNFVETKKTVMGPGSKASHLTYLGDATLGRNVNVGCGTITCNYDGYRKYPTVIGDDCLLGSDTQLVAPVKLGDRAVTGAGSVVTNDIPEGALGVSRARQRNIPGYYDKLRSRYKRDGE